MRILILIPRQPLETGNGVTAVRHQKTLAGLGIQAEILEVDTDSSALIAAHIQTCQPDICHLLHAYRTGKPFLDSGADRHLPFVVTLTGTDIHQDIATQDKGPIIHRVLSEAAAIITQNTLTAEAFPNTYPQYADRLHYLPPGILLGSTPFDVRKQHDIPASAVLFLHPASIRPVKQNLELLLACDPLASLCPSFVAAFCGPVLDPEYGKAFLEAIQNRPWARYLGVFDTSVMASVIKASDVVLNHSLNEGMSNALVESAALGRPILARDIPGNAALVHHGQNGMLYRDHESFLHCATELCASPELRRKLGQAPPFSYEADQEARALQAIYRHALSGDKVST